jgi:DNA helicase-2/ATP-dependent DNA helicase PcrA
VLFRTSHHSAALELELARRNIPFVKFGGLKFLEASHIKDVLAVLRFAQNPRGRMAGFRVAQLMPGIGPATAHAAARCDGRGGRPAAALQAFEPPARRKASGRTLPRLAAPERRRPAWPADMELAKPGTCRTWSACTTTLQRAQADVEQLARLAAGYGSRERFLTELTLDPPEATSDRPGPPLLDEDYLILSTIHSPRARNGRRCTCSTWSTAASRPTWHRHRRGTRRGAPPAVRGDDARQGTPAPAGAAALLRHAAGGGGDRHMYAGRTRFIAEGRSATSTSRAMTCSRNRATLISTLRSMNWSTSSTARWCATRIACRITITRRPNA